MQLSLKARARQIIRSYKAIGTEAAVIFVHGFSATTATWDNMAQQLVDHPNVSGWDFYAFGYATTKLLDVLPGWAIDPDLSTLSKNLITSLRLPPFSKYGTFALFAHSMGGLLVQRAILDDAELEEKVSHIALFGTPSAGVTGRLVGYKRQTRDMAPTSPFIQKLRADWAGRFVEHTDFTFATVAGSRDDFVPPSSSLGPFPVASQHVIDGDHLTMVHPSSTNDPAVVLLSQILSGKTLHKDVVDGARIAIEMGQFRRAVKSLLPRETTLDPAALGDLALALEELNRGDEALALLERSTGVVQSTDAMGILAGRIKRRWLLYRSADDLARAKELYSAAYESAALANDRPQMFYHAINVAFLELVAAPRHSEKPSEAVRFAEIALSCCVSENPPHWELATRGEANLILGRFDEAVEWYQAAVAASPSQRAVVSMYSQAGHIAEHSLSADELNKLRKTFGV
jgi:pimeloyl-ACP methyl ester carboxylesterase